jgi:hypothetical protein
MKSFINDKVSLMEIPDDRVETMKKFTEDHKPLFITVLPVFDDTYKLGSIIYENNEVIGAPVINCIGGENGTISSSAIDLCFAHIAKQIKLMKKEERFDLIYFSGEFTKKIGDEVSLSFELAMFREDLEVPPIIIEIETPEVWDFSDDEDKKEKKKKDKKKKKKK